MVIRRRGNKSLLAECPLLNSTANFYVLFYCRSSRATSRIQTFNDRGLRANMTVGERHAAKGSRNFRVVSVTVRYVATHVKVYQLLERYIDGREDAELVFPTANQEKVPHVAYGTGETL